jgi:hypothetical protein
VTEIAGEEVVTVKSVFSSGIESRMSDMTLASYGPDGKLTDSRYYEAGQESMPLVVRSDGMSNVYALVNMGDMSALFPHMEAEVPDMEYTISSYDEIYTNANRTNNVYCSCSYFTNRNFLRYF